MATAAYQPFVCSVCMNDYKDPKFLACFHSFCLQCLEGCFEVGDCQSIKCPLCRKLTPIPENGIKGLSNNIYVDTKRDEGGNGKLYCGFCCSKYVARFRCRDCEDYLCIQCKDQHVRMKQTKAHDLEHLEEKVPNEKGTELCKTLADKELLFGCYRCNVACCSECWETCHEEHKIGALTEVARAMRQSVEEAAEDTKTQLVEIVKEKAGLVDIDKILNLIGHTDAEIDKIGDQLKRRIDKNKINMKKELRDTSHTLKKEMQTLLESNDAKNKAAADLIKSAMDVLDTSSDVTILTVGTDLKNKLAEKKSEVQVEKLRAPQIDTPDTRCMIVPLPSSSDPRCRHPSRSAPLPRVLKDGEDFVPAFKVYAT